MVPAEVSITACCTGWAPAATGRTNARQNARSRVRMAALSTEVRPIVRLRLLRGATNRAPGCPVYITSLHDLSCM